MYEENGISFPHTAISPAEAAALLPRFEALRTRMAGWTNSPQVIKSHLVAPWVTELVTNPAVLDVVEEITGPSILCWAATFFAKPPRSGGFVGWHQDITYWGLEPAEQVATVWLGLSDAKPDNGCMCYIPGSHRGGAREHQQLMDENNMLLGAQEVALSGEEENRITAVPLEPGQFSIHHSRLLHGSYGNESQRPRIGLSINYMSTAVRQTGNNGKDSAMLVRGTDAYGHFSLEPRPVREFGEIEIAAYREAVLSPSGIGNENNGVYLSKADLTAIS